MYLNDVIALQRRVRGLSGLGITAIEYRVINGVPRYVEMPEWAAGLPSWVYGAARAEAEDILATQRLLQTTIRPGRGFPENLIAPAEAILRIAPTEQPPDPITAIGKIRYVFSKPASNLMRGDQYVNPGIPGWAMQTIYLVAYRNAEADAMGRSWNYDLALQKTRIDAVNAALDALRDTVAAPKVPPTKALFWVLGGEYPDLDERIKDVQTAGSLLLSTLPKSARDLLKGSTWGTIAKGTLTAAAAMVSIVAGGVIAAPLVAAGAVMKDTAETKAAAAVEKQIDQAAADLTALKKEQAAWEQAAASVVPRHLRPHGRTDKVG